MSLSASSARFLRFSPRLFDESFRVPMNFILQDKHLAALRDAETPVTIVLNGIKLHERIESFDQYVVTIAGDVPQTGHKHAITHVQSHRPHAKPRPRKTEHPAGDERVRERPESRGLSEPRIYSTFSPAGTTRTPVIVRKKLRTILPADE